ncbi:hypothetical protein V6N11_068914 [Hibiscus sabdariffa]|uniref:Uncharacterized protein n=1 Tax=Hibiscus sabdariffa TaxID=183260 RepID=A0ABR2PBK2_9ROSI
MLPYPSEDLAPISRRFAPMYRTPCNQLRRCATTTCTHNRYDALLLQTQTPLSREQLHISVSSNMVYGLGRLVTPSQLSSRGVQATDQIMLDLNRSKDLLRFEHKSCSSSPLESALLVCREKTRPFQLMLPRNQPSPIFLKVKFWGKLELDANNNSQAYDIEVLNGNDSKVIEMELMLGVADLHTPKALAAVESAIGGNQPVTTVSGGDSSSGTESDDSSDGSDDTEESDDDNETSCPRELEKSKTGKDNAVGEAAGKSRSKNQVK